MREIKFRGLTNSGVWVYGLPIEYEYGVAITNKNSLYHVEYSEWNFGGKDIIPDTLGQYTGLKDSKGVEIYEGDIVIFGDKNISQEVVFRKGQFMALQTSTFGSYIGLGYCDWEKHSEVIGNIHENSNLLENQ